MTNVTGPVFSTVQNQDDGVLNASLTTSASTCTISPVKKWINGVYTTGGFNTTAGYAKIIDSTGRYEFISFGAISVDSNNVTTLSSMVRGLSPSASTIAGGTGLTFDANTRIYVCDYAQMWHDIATVKQAKVVDGSNVGLSTTSEVDLDTGYTVPANAWAVGAIYKIHAKISTNMDVGTSTLRAKLNSTTMMSVASISGAKQLTVDEYIVCRSVGGSGSILPEWTVIRDTAELAQCDAVSSAVTIDTTTTNVLKFSMQFTNNSSGNSAIIQSFIIQRIA